MKKILLICLISVVCISSALLPACLPLGKKLNGYVEGEYIHISPTTSGILAELSVRRGQEVKAGDALFSLDMTSLKASLATARAEGAQARAKWNDLLKGRRPEEIDVILQQQEQARVAVENATKDFTRAQTMIETGAISQKEFDDATAAFETAGARMAEVNAQLKTANLGAREDEVAAAKAAVDIAEQKVVQIEKQMADAAPKAPVDGRIEDTFFDVGENVAVGAPVVSLLSPEKIKVRFFVPQARLNEIQLGREVLIRCDGCKSPVKGKVSYISSKAEFTPPVIYSVGSRDKLVFMIEVVPLAYNPVLRPGLPVDVALDGK